MSESADRYEREIAFHDDRYADETRLKAKKYYRIDGGGQRYRDIVGSASSPGLDVLEYGCGTGSLAFDLAASGCSVTGIDISPVAIAAAEEAAADRGVSTRFMVMNAEALEFDVSSFDLVCGSGILHHLDFDVALPEIARVLRPGGCAVFMEPLGTNPLINAYRRLTPSMRTPDEHPLVPGDFRRFGLHFDQVSVEYFNFLAVGAVPLERVGIASSVIPWFHRMDQRLFAASATARKLAWVAVISLTA